MIDAPPSRPFALDVVARLQAAGFQALWAGGCVRDLILGQEPADYDVATAATPEQVMATLPYRAITVGISFGVVRVRHPTRPGVEVEIATFRSDGAYVDGRRPESVVFSSAELDATRRDFTINGMFLDPLSGEVLDYVGGQADLKNHVLRAIGDPAARLREDRLRGLRAVRLAARFQFRIEPATYSALKAMAARIVDVSAERIAQELRRMLVHESRRRAMDLALDTGLLGAIVPPLLALKGTFAGTPVQPEGDLWDNTMLVLDLLPAAPTFSLALAALLHALCKPAAQTFHHGRTQRDNHELAGAAISERACRDLKLSNDDRERVIWLVSHQQSLANAKYLRTAKLKRILAEPGVHDLLVLHRVLALATTGDTDDVDYCEHYLRTEPAGPINPPVLVDGNDLIEHGLQPGAGFATILDQVRDAQLDGEIGSKAQALEWIDRHLADGSLEAPRLPGANRSRRRRPARGHDSENSGE